MLTLGALLAIVVGLAAHTSPVHAAAGDINTIAGTGTFFGGTSGGDGDGGPPLQANIPPPFGIATAPGKYYFSQNGSFSDVNRVRVVQNGTINSVAGGAFPPSPDNVLATQTYLPGMGEVATDEAGDLYFPTDIGLRKVDATTGMISTALAGAFWQVIASDPAGNVYVVSRTDGSVKKIDGATGAVTTAATQGFGGGGIAVDAAGNIYFANQNNATVTRVDAASGALTTVAGDGTPGYSGDGGPATSAQLGYVFGIALDGTGNLYIADAGNNVVRRVDGAGIITTFAGGGPATSQCPYSGDGGPATSATMCSPFAVAPDAAGNVYISDAGNALIRKVDSSGTITRVAGQVRHFGFFGDGGPATQAVLYSTAVALDPSGNLLIADSDPFANNRIREIDHNGIITTVAGGGVGDGLPALSAMLDQPQGLTIDPAGNLLIADCFDNRVRKVDSSGIITSIAGTAASHGPGDGGPATSAGLECPSALAYDSSGNLYIADSTDHRVRRVDTSGVITTVAGTGAAGFSGDGGPASAAQLNGPSGLVFDAAGNLYIADRNNDRVRKLDTSGKITTIAGNGTEGGSTDGKAATSGSVVWPVGLAIAPDGSLIIAESGFASIRRVDAKGIISTIAGNGIPGYSGDGGPATVATMAGPEGIAYDSSGNLLIADNQNDVVRSVTAGTPPPPVIATKKTADCGMTVTQNLTLSDDIGPCPGDGLIIGANGVHLNLNGHTISGSYGHTGQTAGIRATSMKDAKISGGTVTGFDAGVALISGSNNIVTGMTIANNLGSPKTFNDTFGDGIVMFASQRNTISGNTVANNGPFDNIAMIGQGADYNLIQSNTVKAADNLGLAFTPGTGLGIVTNPFLGFDRPRMVSLNANQIIGNTVIDNGSAGISTISNIKGVVSNNLVEHNGFESPFGGAFPGNGIGVTHAHNATPTTSETVQNNQVLGNFRDGIQVLADYNHILDNTGDGNGGFDFRDFDRDPVTFQPSCLNNTWSGNMWGSIRGFFPTCASNGGHQLSGATSSPTDSTSLVPDDDSDLPARPMPS